MHHHVHHHHVHHHHAHHHAAAAHALSGRWVVITVALLSVRVWLLHNYNSCSRSRLTSGSYDGLREVFRREMDVTSWHSHKLKFEPLLSTTNSSEEGHRDLAVTNHLGTYLISITDGNVDHVVHVKDLPLKELHLPHRVSTSLNSNLGSLLTVVDSNKDLGVHPLEETCVIMLQVCFFQMKLKFAK